MPFFIHTKGFILIFPLIFRSYTIQPDELQDIVLLCMKVPDTKAAESIRTFPNVYLMEGNCREPNDLLRAGIKRASQVMVMRQVTLTATAATTV